MSWIIGVFVFLVGITIGSFLNVCIYRLPLERSIAKGFFGVSAMQCATNCGRSCAVCLAILGYVANAATVVAEYPPNTRS